MKLLHILVFPAIFCLVRPGFGWDNKVKPWEKLEDCRIVDSFGNDGDSFHVMHKGKEYVFRICFADCPETSMTYPQRIKEQADWWGIKDTDVVKAGHDATDFTMKLLKGKTFTAYTKHKDARGNSKLGREFVMIRVGQSFLSEALVKAGLARSYGYAVATPDGDSRNDYRHKLDLLEKKAKQDHVGGWKYVKGDFIARSRDKAEDPAVEEKGERYTLNMPVDLYTEGSGGFVGTLAAGSVVYVLDKTGRNMIQVRAKFHGQMVDGQCRRYDFRRFVKSE
jgi:endonuclease YncB( thermonuclease family)